MNTLISIIEDDKANVIGASTDQGDIMLDPSDVKPRSELKAAAVALATKYGVTIPAELQAVISAPQ